MGIFETLKKIIQSAVNGCAPYWAGLIADRLIANGVTIPVRCGKCKYYRPETSSCRVRFDRDKEELAVSPNGFCSDGERKDNGY